MERNFFVIGLLAIMVASASTCNALAQTNPTNQRADPTPQQIISQHIIHLGGRDNLVAKKNMTTVGQLEMSGPFGKFKLNVVTVIQGNKRIVEMTRGSLVIREGTDGQVFWKLNPQKGYQILTGDEKALMQMQTKIFPALAWNRFPGQIHFVGKADVGTKKCYEIDFIPRTGLKTKRYFNIKTGQTEKLIGYLKDANKKTKESEQVTVVPSDFRRIDNVLIPFRQTTTGVDKDSKQPYTAVLTLTDVKFNLPIEEKIFALPDEVKKRIQR